MPSTAKTRLHRLIDERLNQPLAKFVAARRAERAGWRAIATDIKAQTGIEVSHQALRDWFGDSDTAVVS
jgi:hypothetical protein